MIRLLRLFKKTIHRLLNYKHFMVRRWENMAVAGLVLAMSPCFYKCHIGVSCLDELWLQSLR